MLVESCISLNHISFFFFLFYQLSFVDIYISFFFINLFFVLLSSYCT